MLITTIPNLMNFLNIFLTLNEYFRTSVGQLSHLPLEKNDAFLLPLYPNISLQS